MRQQQAIEVGDYRSMGLERAVLERELSGDIQQQETMEVGGYRSRGLEQAVLERELPGDTAARGYRCRRL